MVSGLLSYAAGQGPNMHLVRYLLFMYLKVLFTFVHNVMNQTQEKVISCGENLHNTENYNTIFELTL